MSMEGLYVAVEVLRFFEPRIVEVEFEVSLDGKRRSVRRCLHIGNLPADTTEESMRSILAQSTRRLLRLRGKNG